MPEVSRFYGIRILLYHREHPPAHFHAEYAEFVAELDIETGRVLVGYLPRNALRWVWEWALAHRGELRDSWNRMRAGYEPLEIEPMR